MQGAFSRGLEIPYQVNTQIKNLQSQQIDTTEHSDLQDFQVFRYRNCNQM